MLREGFSVPFISKVTGFEKNVIEELKESL
ncbi:hypothetical protein JOD18_004580 [Gracilibacillus alcaliphilus]|nr:hypothetical protein [Gracilibacillus alcaliphilus]